MRRENFAPTLPSERIPSAREVVVLLLLLLVTALAAYVQSQPSSISQQPPPVDLVAVYNEAISDSAVYKTSNVRPLKPLAFDPTTKKAKVVTVMKVSKSAYEYKPGPDTLGNVYVWVTQVPEVQEICQKFSRDLELSLVQLLGFIPNSKLTNFVVMTVSEGDIIRPAANNDPLTQRPCASSEVNCGQNFPEHVPDWYVKWFADQALRAWIITDPSQPPVGYPWTRLGYTYNWKPGADKYGASEYIIKPRSTVTVLDVVPYQKYCSPNR